MSSSTVPNLGFSLPYEIAVVRPLKRTTAAEREAALQAAHYNTELISQEWIYLDLSTDSGVSAISTAQLPALAGGETIEPGMGLAPEGSRAFRLFSEAMENFLGFPRI